MVIKLTFTFNSLLDDISHNMTDRAAEYSSSSSEPPDHLRTNIPFGSLARDTHDIHDHVHDESDMHYAGASRTMNEKAPAGGEEEEDEDIDALIAELESEDGDADEE